MERKVSKIKFVGLHAHSVAGSIFDAIGYPQDHMDFAYANGCDALALTDHGNMNGLAYQVLHAKKMQEAGKDFKPIFGCEAYFTPSIADWREAYEKAMQDKKAARSIKQDEQAQPSKMRAIARRPKAFSSAAVTLCFSHKTKQVLITCSSWYQSHTSQRTSIAIHALTMRC